MGKLIDLTGRKFGRLTVIERAGTYISPCGSKTPTWLCKCDCGNMSTVLPHQLKSGKTRSCGCLHNELLSHKMKTHGMRNTKLYNKWYDMKRRCYNKKNKHYADYGGRGITVATHWKDDFLAFYADVSKLPHFGEKGYSLDRIDNNGNYQLNNIRWATIKEQANNKRNNHLITYNGETHTIAEWAGITGIPYKVLLPRLTRYHWDTERALTEKAFREENGHNAEKGEGL